MTSPSVKATCILPNCTKVVYAHGICSMHDKRIRRHGDPNATPRFTRNPADRFWKSVAKGSRESCWIWQAKINNNGYGIFRTGSGAAKTSVHHIAHRYAYELVIGPIPAGLQIDHLCRVRACVNPHHMEPVTPGENTRRAWPARKRYCFYNHEFTEANTYRQPGTRRRSCLRCRQLRARGMHPKPRVSRRAKTLVVANG